MPFLEIDGAKLHYLDQGQGQPVLLLHAFPLSGAMYAPQLEALSSKYRFIVPDHRGFGQSSSTSWPTEMGRMAQDALAVLDQLGIARAVVGGVSMGGYATLAMLAERPERVKAAVLVDTQAAPDDLPGKARREELARGALAKGMSVLVEAFMPRLLAPSAGAELRARVQAMIEANSADGSAAALRGLALRPDRIAALSRYMGPALIVVGELDPITPVSRAEEMARALANAQLVRVPGAGHLSNLEAPAFFNESLDRFLSSLSG